MSKISLVLVVAGFALAGCTNASFDGPPNGSSNAECQHAGGGDTGYVVNCARHNDDRDNQREILH